MFDGLHKVQNINLKSFDTKNVRDMSYMFRYCDLLSVLDLSHFDTRQVTNMEGMFYHCTSATQLIISSFDTS